MTSVMTKLLALALFACLIASAGPIAPCPTASLAVYLAATAPCEVGSFEFSGFAYSNSFFPALPGPSASNILVTPSNNPADPGLDFSSAWTAAGAGNGMDSTIGYLVATVSGAAAIDEAVLGITDTISSSPVFIFSSETLCVGSTLAPGQCPAADIVNLYIQTSTSGSQQTSASFGPVSELAITNDIFIEAKGANGSGNISDNPNNLPTLSTPEPGTPWLSLAGLLMLWSLARVGAHRLRLRQARCGIVPAA
jgi:hypothetical protein